MMAPGVLLDAAAERSVRSLDAGQLVTATDLEACCRRQGRDSAWRRCLDPYRQRHLLERPRALPGWAGYGRQCLRVAGSEGCAGRGGGQHGLGRDWLRDPRIGCQLPGYLILPGTASTSSRTFGLKSWPRPGISFAFICMPLKFIGAAARLCARSRWSVLESAACREVQCMAGPCGPEGGRT